MLEAYSPNPPVQIKGRDIISENFVRANQNSVIETVGVQQGVRNYLSGSDSRHWQTDVRGFSHVLYHDVWKGVDLKLYGDGPNLEQEYIVTPCADYGQIQVAYEGIERLSLEKGGFLLVKTASGAMQESALRIYQELAGRCVKAISSSVVRATGDSG